MGVGCPGSRRSSVWCRSDRACPDNGFHSPFLVLLSLLWLPAGYLFCLAEERDLVLRFGDAYRDYQARTGMLWPRRS